MRYPRIKSPIVFLTFLLAAVFLCEGQDAPIPLEVQYRLLTKIVEFDRRFQALTEKKMVLAVVYQRKYRPSLEAQEEIAQLVKKNSNQAGENEFSLDCIAIDLSPETDLKQSLAASHASLLYIAPLRSVDLGTITSVSRELKINTFTGVQEYAERGVAVTIGINGNKPQIIVNLTAAKAEGSNYSSQLLGLARVIE
jgi:uncharacterized protein DUF4154